MINTVYPNSKFINSSVYLTPVASFTTWYAVVYRIPFSIVDSINAVVDKITNNSVQFRFYSLTRFFSAIKTFLLRYFSNLFFGKAKIHISTFGIVLNLLIESIESRFSNPNSAVTNFARMSLPLQENVSKDWLHGSAITLYQPSNLVTGTVFNSVQYNKFPKSLSCQINKGSSTPYATAVFLVFSSKLIRCFRNLIATIALTNPSNVTVASLHCINNHEFSNPLSNITLYHVFVPKRISPKISVLLSRQYLLKSLETIREYITDRFHCLDVCIISQGIKI